MKERKDYIFLYIKGMGMGMADVVPGISGGTIALITGIYEDLLYSIQSIDLTAARLLARFRFVSLWKKINGAFLFPVLAGIATSVVFFSQVIRHILSSYPILVWSFFFGLILTSAPLILRGVAWSSMSILTGLLGIGVAYWITLAHTVQLSSDPLSIFFCGTLASCAMILPGISGAFILLLLGKYTFLIQALGSFDIISLSVFILGCILGILLFSKFLSWILQHFRAPVLTLLAGFMVGSLNAVWPWKYQSAHQNMWPGEYLTKTGQDPQLLYAIVSALLGSVMVILITRLSVSLKTKL